MKGFLFLMIRLHYLQAEFSQDNPSKSVEKTFEIHVKIFRIKMRFRRFRLSSPEAP